MLESPKDARSDDRRNGGGAMLHKQGVENNPRVVDGAANFVGHAAFPNLARSVIT
jgi:hypothetical protein